MRGRFRPPMFVIAAALTVLMALLALLQYRWLGRISEADRESRQSTISARAAAFASDFDKELTAAYMLFQLEPSLEAVKTGESIATRFGVRYDRWQSTSRFPRLIKDYYVAGRSEEGAAYQLRRFDPATRVLEPVEWPEALADLRRHITSGTAQAVGDRESKPGSGGAFFVRMMIGPLWEEIPAVVVPMPMVVLDGQPPHAALKVPPSLSYTLLVFDREHVTREVLPALARQHLADVGGVTYDFAVVRTAGHGVLSRSSDAFELKPDASADAVADLFQVRTQEFAQMAADIRRFTMSATSPSGGHTVTAITRTPQAAGVAAGVTERLTVRDAPVSILVDQAAALRSRALVTSVGSVVRGAGANEGRWRLLVTHPSGSLAAAVNSTRQRNLLVSSSILAVLAASMALLVLSARRSQEVARQQMEFVAAVSHELRTPLAVIRSAGDNLAAGVVGDANQIRRYGELVRSEGRRLSEMVEQILEFAGIQSGQRRFEPRPVDVPGLIADVLSASAALLDDGRIETAVAVASDLPPALGDEPALRRVLQNLIGNAIKYGGEGRWIGVRASRAGDRISIAVADRGRGIPPSDQARIFEPFYRAADVVAAQIQGAGLGLSLVHRIVEAHGGSIDVRSAPGEGSEFVVHLPVAGPEPVAGNDPQAAEAPRYT